MIPVQLRWSAAALYFAMHGVSAQSGETPLVEPASPAAADVEGASLGVITVAVNETPIEPEASSPDDGRHLAEVVVTATKRAQSLRQIPASITALDGQKLEEQGARDMTDFLDQVPGISLQQESADQPRKIAIRGVGPSTTSNQTVGVVLSDVPLNDPYGNYTIIDPDPWDMKTVEILKGPQGTLFGASSLNGLIRYVPNGAELGQWSAKGFYEISQVKEGATEPTYGLAVNVPIGSTLAIHGAGLIEHTPGLIDFDNVNGYDRKDGDDAHKRMGRIMATWQPTDRLTVNAWYMHQHRELDELSFVTNGEDRLVRDDAPSPSYADQAFSLSTLEMRYAFDWATLVSVSGYQDKRSVTDLDSTYALPGLLAARAGISMSRAHRDVQAHGFLQELRLVSPGGGRWNWLGGVSYSSYTANLFSDIYLNDTGFLADLLNGVPIVGPGVTTGNGISLSNQAGRPLDAGEKALFGEVTRELTDALSLTLGGRLYRYDVSGTVITGGLLSALASGQPTRVEHASAPGQGFSPKVALTYAATRNVLLYSTVSRGFQYGGINVSAVPGAEVPPTFDSSTLWNYEAGFRTDWLDRTLRFDVTAFYLDWKNAQIDERNRSGLGGYVSNVGAAVNKGVEGTLRYLTPIRGLSIDLSASYIDSRTVVAFVSASGNDIPNGWAMPLSPHVQTATTLSYALQLGNWMTTTSLQHTYQGEAWNNIDHEHRIGGYGLLDLTLGVAKIDTSFMPALTLVIDNLTDKRGLATVSDGQDSALTGLPRSFTRPRTVSLRLSADFR